MKSVIEYLPVGETATSVAAVLDAYIEKLYLVGSAARKYCYSLKGNTNGFDFLFDGDEETSSIVQDLVEHANYKKYNATNYGKHVFDFDSFDLSLRVSPVADFLVTAPYAGDALVIQCKTGRPICLPEYMNLRPTLQIRTFNAGEVDPVWQKSHVENLGKFESELTELMTAHVEALQSK